MRLSLLYREHIAESTLPLAFTFVLLSDIDLLCQLQFLPVVLENAHQAFTGFSHMWVALQCWVG